MKLGYSIILTVLMSGAVMVNGQEDARNLLHKRNHDSSGLFKRINYNTLAASDLINSPEWQASMAGKSQEEQEAAKRLILSRAQAADDKDKDLSDQEALANASKSVVRMKKFLIENTNPGLLNKAKYARVNPAAARE